MQDKENKEKLNILVISQYYYPESFRINDVCETLVNRGHDVTVITGLPNYPMGKISREYKFFRKRKEIINGVNVIRSMEIGRHKGIIFRILNYLSYMITASFKTFFIGDKFDCVYVYEVSPVTMIVPGIMYKKRYKKPLIVYCLDLWPECVETFGIKKNTKLYKWIEKFSKWVYSKADIIHTSSKTFISSLDEKIGKTIPKEYFPQYAEEYFKPNIKEENGQFDFVFAGNVGKAQSMETIVKVANRIKDIENIKIHIVGDGTELANTEEATKTLGLQNIIFYGRKKIEEMQEYYNMADAMIVTLQKDDFASSTLPGKVQSYMATQKPIIASADGETKNIIEEAGCGLCTEAENGEFLAESLKQFVELNKEDRAKMGENSLKYYKENFEKNMFIKKLEESLRKEVANYV